LGRRNLAKVEGGRGEGWRGVTRKDERLPFVRGDKNVLRGL